MYIGAPNLASPTTTTHICPVIVVNKTVTSTTTTKPVFSIVYFMEDGCPYCAQQTPIINDIAKTHNVSVINLTSDIVGPSAVKQYNVSTTPTTIILKNGKEVTRFTGITDEKTILNAMK